MRFEAHLLTEKWFVSHETRIREAQKGLPCIGEPQRSGAASAGGAFSARLSEAQARPAA